MSYDTQQTGPGESEATLLGRWPEQRCQKRLGEQEDSERLEPADQVE
jgi:hypothetical protein